MSLTSVSIYMWYGNLTRNKIKITLYKVITNNLHTNNTWALYQIPMLSGSVVTTASRVLRLRMEETASRYGG
jgi:hypothetical protein